MISLARAFALVAAASVAACDDQPSVAPTGEQAAGTGQLALLEHDPRIEYLLVPGARTEYYDVDSADPLPILTENLLHGQRDPLRRAREEIAALGPDGLRIAQRVLDTYFNDPDGYAHVMNALDVIQRSTAPGARELCLQALRHANDGVRRTAVEALEKHGRAEDYDAVWRVFETISSEFRGRVALALAVLDPVRAQEQYLSWIEGGAYGSAWDAFLDRLCAAQDRAVVGRLSALWPELAPRQRALGAAPCARAGDPTALEFLRAETAADEAWRVDAAVAAMSRAGLVDELDRIARTHPRARARWIAVRELARPELAALHVEALRIGLGSEEPEIALACLGALCSIDDPLAIDRALAMLGEPSPASIASAMEALRVPLGRDPQFARRTFDALLRRREPEQHMPLDQQVHLLKALGQVPLREAAELLLELAGGAQGELQGMPAHRWLLQQVGNIGEPGQRLLFERLSAVKDPLRRIDYIEGVAVRGGPFAREALIELIESDETRPEETLYIADRLIRLGTVAQIAPVLKRVALRTTQGNVRIALQSMLWTNYPGPR